MKEERNRGTEVKTFRFNKNIKVYIKFKIFHFFFSEFFHQLKGFEKCIRPAI